MKALMLSQKTRRGLRAGGIIRNTGDLKHATRNPHDD
jgi:hypothetical protein